MSVLAGLNRGIAWRSRELREFVFRQMRRLPARWFVNLWWPLRKPWQRQSLRVASQGGGIGDELMCLPVFREIKRRNPRLHLTFVTRYPEVFRDVADIDLVELHSAATRAGAIQLAYAYGPRRPPRRPLVSLMAECVGLVMPPAVPSLPEQEPSPVVRAEVEALPRPRIVIQPCASQWTPVKQWPLPLWSELISRLTGCGSVLEVGTEPTFSDADFGPHFHSLAGRTSRADFLWVLGQADVFIGPSSGGMHIAAAQGVRSVIIFGGYEKPEGYQYPRTTAFYRAVECAPCWRADDCPYDLKCMRQITPDEVFAAVRSALAG